MSRWGLARRAFALGWRAAPVAVSVSLVLALVAGAGPAGLAYLSKLLIDALVAPSPAGARTVAGLAVATGLGAGALAVAAMLRQLAAGAAQRGLLLRSQDLLYSRVNAIGGLGPFEDPGTQDRLRLADEAATSAPTDIVDGVIDAVVGVVSVLGFVAVLLAMWPPLGVALLVAEAPALLTHLWLARRSATATESVAAPQRRQFFYRSLLTDLRAAKELRLYGTGGLLHGRAMALLRDTSGVRYAVERRETVAQAWLAVLATAVTAGVTVFVVLGVYRGSISLGDMTLYLAAVAGVQAAVRGVIFQLGRVSASLRLFRHFDELLSGPADLAQGDAELAPLRGAVRLHDVWFRYGPDGPWILRGVSLTIEHGRSLGVVGLNGAGKSTLVKLLCRFYDPQRGRITWDGVDIRDVTLASLRARIGATFQDYMTYELSAADNVGFGDVEHLPDRARIEQAATRAEIDGAVRALPRGYDTLLSRSFADGEQHGVLLSGGQWQRLALARSLMRADADLLILDEPSSGLDALAEQRIHRQLALLRQGRTSLLVSHRMAALREADEIVVLADGIVAERGAHASLMAAHGLYAELFTAQAAGFQLEASR
ncbi:ABC transporter ATP-binding protein [Catellatospora methionotrophica]|uniref:ABC transporter ATP-binding protein n=1 Tax=Catellatospora methionotrophica TaxID=121620 RepID=UPI003409F51A